MSVYSTIEKLNSTKVLRTLDNELVGKKICTMEPDAPIKKQGDTVYFSGLNEVKVNDYNGVITYEEVESGSVALLIDKKKVYGFKVDDIQAYQSNIDVKGSQMENAAYQMLNAQDQYIFSLHDGAGMKFAATVTESNVLSQTSKMARLLQEKNVKDKWLAVPPWYEELLDLAGVKFSINEGMDGAKGGMKWASYRGLNIMCSNNVVTTGSEGSYESKIMAGSYNSIVFAQQLNKTKVTELENSFECGCAGLTVFGAKVIKPNELVTFTATQGAITSI